MGACHVPYNACMLVLLLALLACSDSGDPSADPKSVVDTAETGVADDSGASDSGHGTDTGNGCESCPESTAVGTYGLGVDVLMPDTSRTQGNPLKGFMTSYLWGAPVTDFPDQMEFLYLPMNELWGPDGELLETGLEPHLVAAESRGHHAVLRVYVDYPNRPSGLPDHLLGSVACAPYTEHGGGCSPDYDHPDLVAAMVGLIEVLGDRYDGDPRLGFVQVGLLGFWGEWHTWPHTDWFPSDETQRAVLDAYSSAFETTQLQVRRAAVHSVDLRMGFHDDSFAHSTLGEVDWFFLPGLEAAGAAERWQQVAIGGELRPELQGEVFSDDYVLDTYSQDVLECIEATHASYLLNYYAFNGAEAGYLGSERAQAEYAALRMGYMFELTDAALTLTGLQDGFVQAEVTVQIAQSGVAPFYYPVFLQLEADSELHRNSDDLSTLLPGEHRSVHFELGQIPVAELDGSFALTLTSEILQSTQSISLGTSTPWSEPEGPTLLQWEVQCDTEAGVLQLGEVASQLASGCDCVCDVDGILRTCGGEPCGVDD
jgi:hypothetical protein